MKPSVAMILAAGLGTRMRPLTDDRPKALVEVAGRTLIDHLLDRFADAGVAKAVVNAHAHADRLETHLKSRARPTVVISDERDELLETGGGLVKARPLLGDGAIYVANIDSVWTEDAGAPSALDALAAAYDPERMDALLLLAETARASGYHGPGDFLLASDGRITRRGDRPGAPYAYMGVQILHTRLLDGEPVEKFSANRLWDKALAAGRAYGLAHAGDWMHVGDPDARAAAERRLAGLAPRFA